MKPTKLRVLVDVSEDALVKSAKLPMEAIVGAGGKVIEVEVGALSAQLQSAYSTIVDAVSKLPQSAKGYELDHVTFTLALDSTGGVSLLSAISATAKSQVGITFRIRAAES